MEASAPARRPLLALAAAGLVLWVALAWGGVLSTGLWGWDNYPLIAAGRLGNVADFGQTFGEELMAGRYPLGSYWRPLVHLSFALDYALWGLEPCGYHATDLALLALNTLLVAEVARRWFGARAALVAALVFGGNLVHEDVLGVPARRADALALLFTLLALAAALGRTRRGRWLAALACAAALASKESGAVAVLVVSGAYFATAPGGAGQRLRAAAREASPAWLAFAVALALRTWALGGIGGSREAEVGAAWSESAASIARYFPAAFAPTQVRLLFGSAALSSVVALALLALGSAAARRDAPRAFLPLGAWFLALAAITAMSRAERGWYELPFVAVNALFAAALFGRGPGQGGFGRAAAALALAWAALSFYPWRANWPWRVHAPEAIAAGEAATAFLERFAREVDAARPGAVVRVPGLPLEWADPRPWLDGRPRTFAVLAPYSVAAYAELRWPDRRVRVVPPAEPRPPQPDEVVVVLER